MCNACGFMCCGSDEFEKCGCEHCECPDCWPDEDEDLEHDDLFEDQEDAEDRFHSDMAKRQK